MRELELPIIKIPELQAKHLSMDDYVKFVAFNLKHTMNKKAVDKWKRLSAVNVKFRIFD